MYIRSFTERLPMSDFSEPVSNELNDKEIDEVTPRRSPRKRLVIVAIAAVVALLGISMLMHLGPFAKDAQDPSSAQQDTTSVRAWPFCSDDQIEVADDANTPPGGPMMTKCVSVEEYERQLDEDWAINRQSVIDANARLRAGIDDLQAQFDAAPTLSSKLSRVLTIFCHSDLQGDRFDHVPNEKRADGIAVSTAPPSAPSAYGNGSPMESHYGPSGYYNPFVLSGDFDQRAERLWNTNWDAQAVNFALPASFELAVVQMGCDHNR